MILEVSEKGSLADTVEADESKIDRARDAGPRSGLGGKFVAHGVVGGQYFLKLQWSDG